MNVLFYIIVVLLLAGGAFALYRRNKSRSEDMQSSYNTKPRKASSYAEGYSTYETTHAKVKKPKKEKKDKSK